LEQAQQRQKKYADKSRRHVTFAAGDQVLLSTRNLAIQPGFSKKLLPRFIGPFTTKEARSDVTYKLDLPAKLKIHNVFHISLLRHYTPTANCKAVPLPEILEGEVEYEVEAILDHKGTKSKHFLVKWKGYPSEDNTWEPEVNLQNCHELLMQYKHAHNLA